MSKINKFSQLNERMDFSIPISIEKILQEYPDCKLHGIDKEHDKILDSVKWKKVKFAVSCGIYVYEHENVYLFVHAIKGPIHLVTMYDSYNVDYISQRFVIVGRDSLSILDPDRNEIEDFHYR